MSVKGNTCVVVAAVNDNEKELFTAMAHDMGVSCGAVMRRLVRFFLDGRISWDDLFKQSKGLLAADEPNDAGKSYVRAILEPEEYIAFAQIAEDWGSSTAALLKRLILLYIHGKIERKDIW